jgi:hypothetical protein
MVYDDAIAPVLGNLGGVVAVRRASHVEPQGLEWIADMAPVNGPLLGPFPRRAEALAAEKAWLLANEIPIPGGDA